ncbi:hypothetical protein GCM10009839_71360 [Catenulispora yoronensis]|uniref:Prevent-host-death family protein n=1 Tax=Catenulispora yoronensis TaxID=450799 RepID=A0ABP5GRA1_9ACTN
MSDRGTVRSGRRVDAARLPADLVELIAGLAPGEVLTITRDGEDLARVTGAGGPLEGTVIRSGTGSGTGFGSPAGDVPQPVHHAEVTVVATAMKLSETVRTSLSTELGADYIVLDMESAPDTVDILLVPPISPQLLGSLRERFPRARVMVAELDDPELGISYKGPVQRLLDSGADAYLASTTLPRLARQLDRAITHRTQLTADSPRLAIEPRGGF